MVDAVDHEGILLLPGLVAEATSAWAAATGLHDLAAPRLTDFRVAVAGPIDSGKSTLVDALVRPRRCGVVPPPRRVGPDTTIPVEYRWGREVEVLERYDDGSGQGDRWRHVASRRGEAIHLGTLLGELSKQANRLCVTLPSPLLRDWRLRLLDMPSFGVGDDLHDRRVVEHLQDAVDAVLYVSSSRGMADIDLELIQHVGADRVAVVANIRDAELVATRAIVEVEKCDEIDGLGPGFAVPLDLHALSDETGPERRVLTMIFGYLRGRELYGALPELRAALARGEKRLSAIGQMRLEAVERLGHGAALEERLRGVAELLALRDWLRGPARVAGDTLARADERLTRAADLPSGDRAAFLEQHAGRLARAYNVRAGARRSGGRRRQAGRVGGFGEGIVAARSALRDFVENIESSASTLDLTSSDVEGLRALARRIHDGRVELALLGMFSSGKSSLANALLGVRNDDNDPKLLPTAVRAETSVACRLEYSPEPRLLEAEWLDSLDLRFLSEPMSNIESGGLRVHQQEIQAFSRWIRTGAVRWSDCELQVREVGAPRRGVKRALHAVKGPLSKRSRRATPRDPFDALLETVQSAQGKYAHFVHPPDERREGLHRLPVGTIATGVHVRRFATAPPSFEGMSVPDVFRQVKDDASIALRLSMLRVGYPRELLRHAAIIDTPGTDSLVPHHRMTARNLIQYRHCPVIYCFLAQGFGGLEDRENIEHMRACQIGSKGRGRVFFAVTCKRQVPAEQHREVRDYARRRLREMGVHDVEPYFVEAVGEDDGELTKLERDIERFVMAQQGPQYELWIEETRRPLREAAKRAARKLRDLDRSDEEWTVRQEELRGNLERAREVRARFNDSREWGVPWGWGNVEREIGQHASFLERELDDLQHRDDFELLEGALESAVEELNRAVGAKMTSTLEALRELLRSRLSELAADRPVRVPAPDRSREPFFSGAKLIETARSLEWKSWWWFRWPSTKAENIEKNRERLKRAWAHARKSGWKRCQRSFSTAVQKMMTSVDAHIEGIEQEMRSERPEDFAAERRRLVEIQRRAETWERRLEDLRRQYGSPQPSRGV